MHPSALHYLGIPGQWIFILLLVLAAFVLLRRVHYLIALLRAGQVEHRLDQLRARSRAFIVYVLGQRRLFHDIPSGTMHAVIFLGFLVLSIGTVEMLWQGLTGGAHVPLLGDTPYLLPLLDSFRILVLGAVVFAAYRRLVVRPARLTLAPGGLIILGLIAGLMLTDLLAEGFRLAGTRDTGWWAPAGRMLAEAFAGIDAGDQQAYYAAFWWTHAVFFLGFLVYLPYSKHLHILAAPPNVFLRSLYPKGALRPADLGQKTTGVASMQDFTWKQLLDLYSCTECGRCQEVCPAHLAGKPLSPKELVLGLRARLTSRAKSGHHSAFGGAVSKEALWSCTTCGACQERCPVFIEHVAKIIDLRRGLTESGVLASCTARSLEALALVGNPQHSPPSERKDWGKPRGRASLGQGQPVEVLYWVGCTGAYDASGQQISTAMSNVLQLAQVNYAILGDAEQCCGDPARRIGEEGLFQQLAQRNIETLQNYQPRRILTHCPHCYNMLKNEYPQFGGQFSVVHHSEFIAELIDQDRLRFAEGVTRRVTYQDPCYLGRYNNGYDQPRQALRAMPTLELAEAERVQENALCCGGGGGQVWLEANEGQRINYIRFAQLQDTKSQIIATACPFCKLMLDDAANYHGVKNRVQVKDIAELVYENCSLR